MRIKVQRFTNTNAANRYMRYAEGISSMKRGHHKIRNTYFVQILNTGAFSDLHPSIKTTSESRVLIKTNPELRPAQH